MRREVTNLYRNGNSIYFEKLNHPRVVSCFIREILSGIRAGYDTFDLNFEKVDAFFPNAVVPISGIIDHLRTKGYGFNEESKYHSSEPCKMLQPSTYDKAVSRNVLNRVWKFTNSSEISDLVDAYLEELRKEDRFFKGQLDTITWSLNEVMDNVLIHSDICQGYVMGQVHKNAKNIAFTVFDNGQGIYNSLKNSEHKPRTVIDAITLSIKEGVTRDRSIGQGNGLYGLYSMIKKGKGSLVITSGGAGFKYNNGNVKNYHNLPTIEYRNPGTIIDFQLNYSEDFQLDQSVIIKGKICPIQSFSLESLEDDYGKIVYRIKDRAEGTGTREAALRVKNDIFNMLSERKQMLAVDFTGVEVMSSSFADELIAKMILEMGLFQFNQMIRLRGLDQSQQIILQKSVIQRLIESINERQQ